MIQGIQPGPTIITEQAPLFWGVVVSMWIGNVFLLILNLPLIGLWVRMVTVPYHLLYPAIMVFCAIGVFSISNTTFDVYLMALFGLLGYVFHKLGCEPTPLLLGFILGPPMEEFLRRALVLSEGRVDVLLREPLSAALLAVAAALLGDGAAAGDPQETRRDLRVRRLTRERDPGLTSAERCPATVWRRGICPLSRLTSRQSRATAQARRPRRPNRRKRCTPVLPWHLPPL